MEDSAVRARMVDPPEGWKYGFPKLYTPREGQTLGDWLIEQGYPKKFVDEGLHHYSRYWAVPGPDYRELD